MWNKACDTLLSEEGGTQDNVNPMTVIMQLLHVRKEVGRSRILLRQAALGDALNTVLFLLPQQYRWASEQINKACFSFLDHKV